MSATTADTGQAPGATTSTANENMVQPVQNTVGSDDHDCCCEPHKDDNDATENDEDEDYYSDDEFSDTSSRSADDLRENRHMMTLFESSYKTATRKTPIYAQYEAPWTAKLVYDLCSPATLKALMRQRGLTDPFPSGLTLKFFYLKVLHQADRAWKFRFLDLPAEMRNHVYRHLLTWPDDRCAHHKNAYPQILATCKQVHQEAKDILYAENVVTITFLSHTSLDELVPETTFTSQIHKQLLGPVETVDFLEIPEGVTTLPRYLRRVERLHVIVFLHCCFRPRHDYEAIDYTRTSLLTLASFLMNNHRIRDFKLELIKDEGDLDGDEDSDEDGDEDDFLDAEDLLHPLRRLTGIKKVLITGNTYSALSTTVAQDMQRNTVEDNLIERLRLLLAEGQLLLQSKRTVKVSDLLYPDPCTISLYENVSSAIDEYYYLREESELEDIAFDEDMMRDTADELQRLLNGMDRSLVAKHSKAFREARRERKLFERTQKSLKRTQKSLNRTQKSLNRKVQHSLSL